ncbi:MAG: hypothetical protein K2W96_09315 [Gemmataceae bacterium]|nr:hypothetical protein [Gemmataceae bacterium]
MNPEPLFPNSEADAYDRFDSDDPVAGLQGHPPGQPSGSAYEEALD